MTSPSPGKRRIDTDVIKLIESKHEVILLSGMNEFLVTFHGPKDTPFNGGVWLIRVDLPEKYPFKSPSIGFLNRIYHPNIDELSGTVCLDVINQAWTSLFDLKNIFESFLPQLLAYPNATDPLNGEAAAMFLHKREEYTQKARAYVTKFAQEQHLKKLDIQQRVNKLKGDPSDASNENGDNSEIQSDVESSLSGISCEDDAQTMDL
ncbi:hypothetical protein A3Q56_03932 [Intoshia linei]|uniref:Ubiquitin-conjugating enzyme E2 H n=1 Tax=Intoshia linei TaxID=1819745 RepID=A0A177B225_9BILA|nr:hypothetical protein A3Q56_03932 [Intoshia linei]